MEGDAENMAGDVFPVGATPCQVGTQGAEGENKEETRSSRKKSSCAAAPALPVTSPREQG